MQVSVEATGNIARRMTVAIPGERLEQEVAERLKRLAGSAKLPGFRPGKAPLKLIEAQYGEKLRQEVAGELIQASFYQALGEQGLKAAGGPRIAPKPLDRGRDLEYVAEFEVYPQVVRLDIAGARIERPVSQVGDDDVERTLEIMRRQRSVWRAVDRPAREGDRVTVDFEGRLAGQPFAGGAAKNFPLVLGSRALIEGFEQGLDGVRAGQQRTLDLRFPADYGNTALAGQAVAFEVRVNEVAEPVPPALDADFARQFGVADGSLEALRAEVRSNLERELAERARVVVREQVFRQLLENNPLELPQALEEAEIERLVQKRRSALAAQGIPAEKIAPPDRAALLPEARRRATLGLILAEVVKVHNIVPDPAAVRARLELIAASYETPQEFIQWHYAAPGRLGEIEAAVMEDQAVELLLKTAEFVERPIAFQELMRQGTH
jgi:trigger factor